MFADYVDQHKDISTPLINVRARNLTWESGDTQIDDLRASEKELISLGQDEHYLAMFDLRHATRMTAGLSIVRTLFVCAVLAFGSLRVRTQRVARAGGAVTDGCLECLAPLRLRLNL